MFDSYTREQLRRTYAQAWAKHLAHAPVTALEALIIDVISVHGEYQTMVADEQAALAFEPNPQGNAENPFLHMGLHLAVREQLSIDRPPGVRALHRRLQARHGAHGAEHALMEALGEALWRSQRAGTAPDEALYLRLAQRHLTDS
jgi:hypothetical protein